MSTILSVALLVLDYIFVAPNVLGAFFFGKTTIVIYWLLEIGLLSGSRLAYRYYRTARTRTRTLASNATPVLLVGNAADAELLIRSIESGAVRQIWPIALLSPALSDRGQMVRGIPVLGGVDDLTGRGRSARGARQAGRAGRDDAVGARAQKARRNKSSARRAARV